MFTFAIHDLKAKYSELNNYQLNLTLRLLMSYIYIYIYMWSS